VLLAEGVLAHRQSDFGQARSCLEQALRLFQDQAEEKFSALVLFHLGWTAHAQGRFREAKDLYQQGLRLVEGKDDFLTAQLLGNLGMLAYFSGEYDAAQAWLERSRESWLALGDLWGQGFTTWNLSGIAFAGQRYKEAAKGYVQVLLLAAQINDRSLAAFASEGLAGIGVQRQKWRQAAEIFSAAASIRETIGYPRPPWWNRWCETKLNQIRGAIPAPDFTAIRSDSEALTIDQLINLAAAV
jgi:tetratricopeptide (TPR) repeat protein